MVNMEDEKQYEITHHVASGKFTYFEMKTTTTVKNAVAQAKWFQLQFKDIEK